VTEPASRLCSEAEANGIIVSGFACELCQEEDAARFVALGERRFKGFADKAQVFRFEWRNFHMHQDLVAAFALAFARKKRIISQLASGPRVSVQEPPALPPDQAWPAP
jgi:hypothetical protein